MSSVKIKLLGKLEKYWAILILFSIAGRGGAHCDTSRWARPGLARTHYDETNFPVPWASIYQYWYEYITFRNIFVSRFPSRQVLNMVNMQDAISIRIPNFGILPWWYLKVHPCIILIEHHFFRCPMLSILRQINIESLLKVIDVQPWL